MSSLYNIICISCTCPFAFFFSFYWGVSSATCSPVRSLAWSTAQPSLSTPSPHSARPAHPVYETERKAAWVYLWQNGSFKHNKQAEDSCVLLPQSQIVGCLKKMTWWPTSSWWLWTLCFWWLPQNRLSRRSWLVPHFYQKTNHLPPLMALDQSCRGKGLLETSQTKAKKW